MVAVVSGFSRTVGHEQMLLFAGSGIPSFHFSGVVPGSIVSASQIRSEMHFWPLSFWYTQIPEVV